MLLKTCRLRKSAFYCFCYSLRLHTPFDIRKVLEVFFLFLFVLRQQNDFFRCLLLNLIFQAYLLSQQKRIWHRGNFIEHIGLTGATNISWYNIYSEVAQKKAYTIYDLLVPKAFDPLSLSAPIILSLSESELTQQRHLIQQDRMMIVKQADKAD